MLGELLRIGMQLLQMIGMGCLLWGTFLMISAVWAGRGPLDFVKGVALLMFGAYLAGLGRVI